MSRVTVISLPILFSVVIACPAKAEEDFLTGSVLYLSCSDKNNQTNQYMCDYWIKGFLDGVWIATQRKSTLPVCLPDAFTGKQARPVIEKYMRGHPAMLHLPAGGIALLALVEAFPCKK